MNIFKQKIATSVLSFSLIACMELFTFIFYKDLSPTGLIKLLFYLFSFYVTLGLIVGSFEHTLTLALRKIAENAPLLKINLAALVFTFFLFFIPIGYLANTILLPDKFSLASLSFDAVLAVLSVGVFWLIRQWQSRLGINRLANFLIYSGLFWTTIFQTRTLAGLGFRVRTVQFDFFLFSLVISWVMAFFTNNFSTENKKTAPLHVALLFFFVCGFYILDSIFYPSLYSEIHNWFKILIYLSAEALLLNGICLFGFIRKWSDTMEDVIFHKKAGLLASLCFLLAAVIFNPSGQSEIQLLSSNGYTSSILFGARRVLDIDRDGFSFLFGGGDANDFNFHINPLNHEIIGNGIDEDGYSGDLTNERINEFMSTNKERLGSPSSETLKGNHYNVLLITVDTLQAAHLSAYGYHRKTSPHLKRLAQDGVLFERCYSQANHTVLSFYSILRSRFPIHVDRKTLLYRVGEKSYLLPYEKIKKNQKKQIISTTNSFEGNPAPSLAEILKENGYQTIAIPNDRYSNYLSEIIGVRSGFDFNFKNNPEEKFNRRNRYNDIQMTRAAIETVRKFKKTSFLLWLHYYDHIDFKNHPEVATWGNSRVDRFDSGIAKIDSFIGDVIAELKKQNLYDKTIIIFTADHGVIFTAYGELHGTDLTEQQLHVPFVLRIPGVAPGLRFEKIVGNIDTMPTVLSALGIQIPETVEGWNLLPYLTDQNKIYDRYLFSEGWRQRIDGSPYIDKKALIYNGLMVVYDRIHNYYDFLNLPTNIKQSARPVNSKQVKSDLRRWIEIQESVRP